MNEEFLWYLWQYRLFNNESFTTSGLPLEIVHPGQHNLDAGPDFTNARIRIGDTLWAGNVEIHTKSSDWYNHNHQNDMAFANIILHVVYEHDREIYDINHRPVATFELKNKFQERIYKKYFYYLNNKNRIPCEKDFPGLNPIILKSWTERLFVERLERKSLEILHLYDHNKMNFEETLYQFIAGNFGFKLNEEPFRLLARMLPLHILGKHQNSLFQTEALLFGVAGLLTSHGEDDYSKQLQKESDFLRTKYSLTKLDGHLWKFLRSRPANFPTIRISQFATLIQKPGNLFSKIIEARKIENLAELFEVEATEYWKSHYLFGKTAPTSSKKLGIESIHNILINSVVRFLFFYGKMKSEPEYQDRAIDLMLLIPAESNHIIKSWEKLGVKVENAFESQALIELMNSYCKQKKCLKCGVGLVLLRENN